jgi:hypothetical protein
MSPRRSNTVVGLLSVVPVALSLVLAAGCTSETSTEPPTRSSSESLGVLGICAPLTCCFPGGGGWQDDPFEDQLKSLGCSTPSAYTESYGQSDWWLYSMCPTSTDLVGLVLKYAAVAPYYSRLVVNACLELHALGEVEPTSVFVEWDPTCPGCSYAH